jgi:serine/threonine protein kinase
MGEVYRARDLKLKREIAIKILPEEFSRDADRLIRFQREAEVLASLNHPNIAAIHDLEETNGTRYLVLELVEGETLADRIARGPILVDEALNIAKQIAEALEAAHERGIIHRDLKPANVKLTPEGQVKVLDFGLAKAMESAPTNTMASNSPTLLSGTMGGMLIGTAAYMSPEQAAGKAVDKRTDIWSFGVLLWEMLGGEQLFKGETVSHILASVLKDDPDLSRVPLTARRLLQRCLEKDPRKRLRDIGDIWDLVDNTTPQVMPSTSKLRALVVAVVLALAALAGLAFVHFRETNPTPVSGLFNVSLPDSRLLTFMLSPDGRTLAFVSDQGGPARVWIRPIDSLESRPLSGTDGATFPFWSPDGKNLGFFSQGRLKRIALAGGPAQTLCDAPTARGGAWNRDGVIVFAPNINGGLFRVSQDGGMPVQVTMPVAANDSHRYPEFIQGSDQFLFAVNGDRPETSGIFAASLNGGIPTRLLRDTSHALYVPPTGAATTGALLFVRESTVMALPFDARKLRATGSALPIAQDVPQAGNANFAAFTASENGTFIYRSGSDIQNRTLVWLDSSGKAVEAATESQFFECLALSPDETQVAISILTSRGTFSANASEDVWLHNFGGGVTTRFTFGPGRRHCGVWSPDGSYIVFVQSQRLGEGFFRKQLNSSGISEEVLLNNPGENAWPMDISPDGKLLVYSATGSNSRDDLWLLPLQGEHKPMKYLDSPSDERQAQFSPDGKWIAYSSDESGQFQVYLQTVPVSGAKRQVSIQGGSRPRWRKDGKELYYVSADLKLMSVPIKIGSGIVDVGTPRQLLSLPTPFDIGGREIGYQPSIDGKKFLTSIHDTRAGVAPIVVVWTNWMSVLNK